MQAILVTEATTKEIAALALEMQERRGAEEYALVRKPYQRCYLTVRVGAGRSRFFARSDQGNT